MIRCRDMGPTRRAFIRAGAVAPVLITAIQPAPVQVDANPHVTLKIIMDLMIPASDGMPCASEAGGLSYLAGLMQRDKVAAADLTNALDVAEAFSERAFQKPFGQLTAQEQTAVLKQMESDANGPFDLLRAYVYESYYTQSSVWKLIGYELYPTDHAGPQLQAFDESLIAKVRSRPKLYRDA